MLKTDDKISFGAKALNNVCIKKYCQNTKKYIPCNARFVVLEPYNSNDIEAIKSLNGLWDDSPMLKSIIMSAKWMSVQPKADNLENIRIYALTTQTKNYKNLEAGKILGLAEVREDEYPKNMDLWHLKVKPEAMNVNAKSISTHKGCGSAILGSLKKIYDSIYLESVDDDNIRKFYRNNGFRRWLIKNHFRWCRNLFVRLYNYYKWKHPDKSMTFKTN